MICGIVTRGLSAGFFIAVALTSSVNARTFKTVFPNDENPISENGAWISGRKLGLDWSDVRTVPGFAFGTQLPRADVAYDDSVAVLTGEWGPTQFAQATVKASDCTDSSHQEVELYLRASIAPHSITGYEFNFRCSQSAKAYAEIVRWNGKINDFTYLAHSDGKTSGVKQGDVVTAITKGDVLQSYVNGVLVAHGIDTTYRAGAPGIGFFDLGLDGKPNGFGFSEFMAADALPAQYPAGLLPIFRLKLLKALNFAETHETITRIAVGTGAGFIVSLLAGSFWYFSRKRA